eukprot:contig_17940_g4398
MGVDTYEAIRAHQARKEGTEMNAEVKRKFHPLKKPQIGEDLAAAREVRASKSATNAVAAASAEGSAIKRFNEPGMRDTEEVKLFMRKKTRQMLKAAGVPVGPSHAKSGTPAELPAAGDYF